MTEAIADIQALRLNLWPGVGADRKEHHALFSRQGFTTAVKRLADQEGIFLMTVHDIIMPGEG